MADIRAELRSKTKVHASIRQATGASGAKQHSQLSGRDVPDQHPMSAITGLVSALAKKSDGLEITAEGLVYLTSGGERIAGPYELFSPGDGGHSGPAYVASDEPPEDTDVLWVNTSEPEEAIALGVTAEETAEGVDIYATDELGTKKVSLRHGKDGEQGPAGPQGEAGPAGPQGAPGDDYVLTDEDLQEIAGMVPGGSPWVKILDIANADVPELVTQIEYDLPETEYAEYAFFYHPGTNTAENAAVQNHTIRIRGLSPNPYAYNSWGGTTGHHWARGAFSAANRHGLFVAGRNNLNNLSTAYGCYAHGTYSGGSGVSIKFNTGFMGSINTLTVWGRGSMSD